MNAPDDNSAAWTRTPERSNMAMLRVMTWISLRLGRTIGRVVLRLIALYFMLCVPASRNASRGYLQRVLGRPARWRDIYRHFFWFASCIHDRVYLLNDRFEEFDIAIDNQTPILDMMGDGEGVFLLGAHLGSFEVVRALGLRCPGIRVAMAMYEDNARKINDILTAINPNAMQDVIGLGRLDSMLKVDAQLKSGTIVGMLADRSISNDQTRTVKLLGAPAQMPLGPFRMAAILRRPVFFMAGLYLGGNRYEIRFEMLADFRSIPAGGRQREIERAMDAYTAILETHCRRAPYNWFNFFDFWHTAAGAVPKDAPLANPTEKRRP